MTTTNDSKAPGSSDAPVTATVSVEPVPSVQGSVITAPTNRLRFVDIGVNLGDSTFRGIYHGKRAHEDDTANVIKRAAEAGCMKMMVTGSDLEVSKDAIKLAQEYPGLCYATIGVHPCSATTFATNPSGPDGLLQELETLATHYKSSGLCAAFGEIGLDYDRLHYTDQETQLKYFEAQLDIAMRVQLPLFLHSRAAHADFTRLLRPRLGDLPKRGLVHSFTGTREEMEDLVGMGFDVGVNGCSLKTHESLDVVKAIPMQRLQIETDGPWCEMRPSHASAEYLKDAPKLPRAVRKEKWEAGLMVKGRNEPVAIAQVAHVVAGVKGVSVEEVGEA